MPPGESNESLPIRSKLRFHNLHHVSDPWPLDIHSADRQGSRTHIHQRGQEDPRPRCRVLWERLCSRLRIPSPALFRPMIHRASDKPSTVRRGKPGRQAREASQKTLKFIT
jgi:hypothetical protein